MASSFSVFGTVPQRVDTKRMLYMRILDKLVLNGASSTLAPTRTDTKRQLMVKITDARAGLTY